MIVERFGSFLLGFDFDKEESLDLENLNSFLNWVVYTSIVEKIKIFSSF